MNTQKRQFHMYAKKNGRARDLSVRQLLVNLAWVGLGAIIGGIELVINVDDSLEPNEVTDEAELVIELLRNGIVGIFAAIAKKQEVELPREQPSHAWLKGANVPLHGVVEGEAIDDVGGARLSGQVQIERERVVKRDVLLWSGSAHRTLGGNVHIELHVGSEEVGGQRINDTTCGVRGFRVSGQVVGSGAVVPREAKPNVMHLGPEVGEDATAS